MYAGARRVRHVDDIDVVSRKVRDELIPVVRTIPGFVAYYLVDGVHSTYSITICEDKAGLDQAEAMASEWTQNNLGGLIEDVHELIKGEVVVRDLA